MSNGTQPTGFKPHPAHRQMTPDDAKIFFAASEMLVWPEISQSIRLAGGDEAHMAHFSREVTRGTPIVPWAASHDHETVAQMLINVGNKLKVDV